ncbi:leucine-rich repeat domain-containing protein [Listeria monocytogenes]|nr:leucine-rich repeat domain-containing protein [Listeria monocytogenes]EJU4184895.1 leucine-rich repeat domain-containing protein [Listeria monocytogenes]EKZ0248213.1 leucine-rich repeat domain-containing protein [Listeria monocytogenes]EMB2358823.1 leucine-rich repeat domain-containing protein [Listeria monocytogenes]
MKKRKKRLRQLVVAFLLLNTIGLPIQNSVLANELSTTEEVVTEEVEINEDKTIASEEAEQPTKEIQEEKELSEESTSAVAENAPSEQQTEEITENKEEVKESNQPVEVEKAIEKDVKVVLPNKISVIFPDATVAIVMKGKLGKSSVDDIVTQNELDTVRSVLMSGPRDLSGFETLTNLNALYGDNSQISDISPLTNLTNLNRIDLMNNKVSDISPLTNLINLEHLSLGDNQISDISPLTNLTSLKRVVLNNNQISDISPLANSTNIETLNLDDNQISDISPLTNFADMFQLYLNDNQISDISPLSNLATEMWDLELNDNQISDLNPLTNLINLEYLELDGNQISDISPLSNLTTLSDLYLGNQQVTLSVQKWRNPLTVTNSIKDVNGDLIAPSLMSNGGIYTDPIISWGRVPNITTATSYTYDWNQTVTIGTVNTSFNGTATLSVEARIQYDMHFEIDGMVTTESVLEDDLVTEPAVPNKVGHAFIGWYDAKTGGNKWDFSTDTMPSRNMTLYARFNKLGFVTPEIKPVMPNVVTPIMPGVDPVTPSVEPPTTPGNRPNPVIPPTPGTGGNQTPSNGSGSNTGNTSTTSPTTSQGGKLAKLGENNSLLLQGFGVLLALSGVTFFLVKRKKTHS